jgi:hypothetical protein
MISVLVCLVLGSSTFQFATKMVLHLDSRFSVRTAKYSVNLVTLCACPHILSKNSKKCCKNVRLQKKLYFLDYLETDQDLSVIA